jgi:hypothetical protein
VLEDADSSKKRGTPHGQEIKRMLASREEFLKKKKRRKRKKRRRRKKRNNNNNNPSSLQTWGPVGVTSGDD